MEEDNIPVAVETIRKEQKPRKKFLVIGLVLIIVLILLTFSADKLFRAGYSLTKLLGLGSNGRDGPVTIEIDKTEPLSFTMPARSANIPLNFTAYNVTRGNVTAVLVSSNESIETWKGMVHFFHEKRGVEATDFKFVYSTIYGYREYYFWWHNDTILALDVTDLEGDMVSAIIGNSPPTDDLF